MSCCFQLSPVAANWIILLLGCMLVISGVSAFSTAPIAGSGIKKKWMIPVLPARSTQARISDQESSGGRLDDLVLLATSGATVTTNTNLDYTCTPLLDFRDKNDTINYIDRLDDAIMGGISTSTVRQPATKRYAIWNGVCRTDGGGFCGFRTNPFKLPFLMMNDDLGGGFYIKCRLVSDNEPERRVWKLSTRTKPDRGELLYQAPFELLPSNSKSHTTASIYDDDKSVDDIEWQTIYVPFDTFRLVRGPQVVENGAPLNVSTGIYQLGMTMSQFIFAAATTTTSTTATVNSTRVEKTLPNFRDGYFELHIEEMGVYSPTVSKTSTAVSTVQTDEKPISVLSKVEVKEQRSILIKALFVIARILFFSEQSQRRKSVMRILQNKYRMTRFQAIVWGFRRRCIISTIKQYNDQPLVGALRSFRRTISSLFETISILSIDTIRSILSVSVKISLFYPIRAAAAILARIKPNKTKSVMTKI